MLGKPPLKNHDDVKRKGNHKSIQPWQSWLRIRDRTPVADSQPRAPPVVTTTATEVRSPSAEAPQGPSLGQKYTPKHGLVYQSVNSMQGWTAAALLSS
jgi:hypothetical protein